MLQSGECFLTSAGLQGKAHCTHTASEKRQSSPGWASEEAGPGQDCSDIQLPVVNGAAQLTRGQQAPGFYHLHYLAPYL